MPSGLYLVVMEWMATITGDVWVILDFRDFSLRRKILENRFPRGRNGNSVGFVEQKPANHEQVSRLLLNKRLVPTNLLYLSSFT